MWKVTLCNVANSPPILADSQILSYEFNIYAMIEITSKIKEREHVIIQVT